LRAEPEKVAFWRQRLGLGVGKPVIGLVWQGNPNSPAEAGRSLVSPAALAPLAASGNFRLIALQKLDEGDYSAADTPSGWTVDGVDFALDYPAPDMDAGRDAFIDTAAIMQSLDAVVSVCTAPLHLAGALGLPAFGLLKSVPDWRWMLDRPDTPWYPTMRLLRQQPGEGYGPVIGRLAGLLADLDVSRLRRG
jgi:hypothetical protein